MYNRLCELKTISRSFRTVLVLIFFFHLVQCWRSFNFNIYDPSYINLAPEIVEMNFTIGRSQDASFHFTLKRNVTNAFIHVLSVFDGNGIGKQNLVYGNYTVDLCSFLIDRKGSILLSHLFRFAGQFGELPKRCPLKKKLYYAANMKLVPDHFPSFVPLGNGTLTFTTMTKLREGNELKICTKSSVSYKFENKFEQSQKTKSN